MNKQIDNNQELINFFKDWSIVGGSFICLLYILVSIFEQNGVFVSLLLSAPLAVSYYIGINAVMNHVQECRKR